MSRILRIPAASTSSATQFTNIAPTILEGDMGGEQFLRFTHPGPPVVHAACGFTCIPTPVPLPVVPVSKQDMPRSPHAHILGCASPEMMDGRRRSSSRSGCSDLPATRCGGR